MSKAILLEYTLCSIAAFSPIKCFVCKYKAIFQHSFMITIIIQWQKKNFTIPVQNSSCHTLTLSFHFLAFQMSKFPELLAFSSNIWRQPEKRVWQTCQNLLPLGLSCQFPANATCLNFPFICATSSLWSLDFTQRKANVWQLML